MFLSVSLRYILIFDFRNKILIFVKYKVFDLIMGDKFFEILDNHFVNKMRMNYFILHSDSFTGNPANERQYEDSHLTMIFTVYLPDDKNLFPNGSVRIVMRNWATKKSFSKNFTLSWFDLENPDSVIENIREGVYINSGVESRDFLNDWYEIKKVELRQLYTRFL